MSELPVFQTYKAFVVHDGAILAMRKSAGDMHFAGQWDLPGGPSEAGESDVEALKRQAWIDAGQQIAPAHAPFAETLFDYPAKAPKQRVQVEAYLAVPEGPVATKHQSDYVEQIKWIAFDALQDTKFIAGLRPLIDTFVARFVNAEEQAA